MKYSGTLIAVRDISRSRKLYEGLLGCVVAMDLGVYVAYTNGIALQQEETWLSFIGRDADEITYGANDAELYFEEHEIESFFVRMRVFDIELIHNLFEHSWVSASFVFMIWTGTSSRLANIWAMLRGAFLPRG